MVETGRRLRRRHARLGATSRARARCARQRATRRAGRIRARRAATSSAGRSDRRDARCAAQSRIVEQRAIGSRDRVGVAETAQEAATVRQQLLRVEVRRRHDRFAAADGVRQRAADDLHRVEVRRQIDVGRRQVVDEFVELEIAVDERDVVVRARTSRSSPAATRDTTRLRAGARPGASRRGSGRALRDASRRSSRIASIAYSRPLPRLIRPNVEIDVRCPTPNDAFAAIGRR